MRETLDRFVSEGPSEEELEEAKKNLIGGFPLRIASNAKIVEYLAMMAFYGYPLDWLDTLTDKLAAVHGNANPVAGPFFTFSVPEPTGVVGVVAPQESSLLGLVCVLAPVLATGCSAVVLASEARPLPAITQAEVLATSDVPAGAANILTGSVSELAPWLASHADVNGLDLTAALVQAAGANGQLDFDAESVQPTFDADSLINLLTFYQSENIADRKSVV